MGKQKELTDKQLAFCHEYIKDWNGTQAAVRAGYSEGTARSQAQRLLTNVDIRSEVGRIAADAMGRERDEIKARVITKLVEMAFGEEIRDTDRLRALELLGKYGSLFTDRIEHAVQEMPPLNVTLNKVVDSGAKPIPQTDGGIQQSGD